MDFINEVNEQYLEKLKTEALKRCISSAKKDIPLAVTLVFCGIVLLMGSSLLLFPTLFSILLDDTMKILGAFLGSLGIASSFIGGSSLFEDCRFLIKKSLSDKEKEEIYQEDYYIKNYKSELADFNRIKNLNILKYDVREADDEIILYYETKDNIVEKEIIYAEIIQNTKINDYVLHFTEDGLVLHAPWEQ